jgi:amino acid permease
MFNGFVLFLGSIGLTLTWSLLNFSSPNFKEKVRKEGKKIWDFSFGGKLFIASSLLFIVLLFGLILDFLISFLLSFL